MRGKFVFAMMASVLAGTAMAQDSSSDASSTTTTTTTSSTAVSTSTVAPAADPNATTTTTLSTAVPQKKSPFGFGFVSFSDFNVRSIYAKDMAYDDDPSNDPSDPYAINRFTLRYKLDDNQSIAIRQEVRYNYGRTGKAARAIVGSTRLGYSHSKLAELPGNWNLSSSFFYYLPTSEGSRFNTKSNGIALISPTISREFGKVEVAFDLAAYYMFNSQDLGAQTGAANADYEIDPYVTVGYNFNDYLSAFHSLGTYNVWYRPGTGQTRSVDLYNETGLTVKPLKNVSFTASVDNTANIWDQKRDFVMYSDDETTYRALLSVSL